MKQFKRIISIALIAISAALIAIPAFAAEAPQASVSSGECAVGETVQVTISLKNVTDLTSGDLNVQYNPNILRFVKAEEPEVLKADKEIALMYSEPTAEGQLDPTGKPVHAFYITFLHFEKFPQALNNCDLITLTFEAIGSGECPLVLSATSFYIDERLTAPVLTGGMITVTGGKEADSWDYGANADAEIMYTDPSYTFAINTVNENGVTGANDSENPEITIVEKSSSGKVVGIVVAVVVAVGAVAAVAIYSGKKKNIVSE